MWHGLLCILAITDIAPLACTLLTNRAKSISCSHKRMLPSAAEELPGCLSVVQDGKNPFNKKERLILHQSIRSAPNIFQAGNPCQSLAGLKALRLKFTLRKCLCFTIFLGVCHLFFSIYLIDHGGIHRIIELLEQRIKYSLIHDLQNEGVFQERIMLRNNEKKDRKIFFLHIPRTSGCAISTDLFGVHKPWISDHSTYRLAPFNINKKKNIYDKWSNSSIIVIRGFFGYDDIAGYKGPGHESKKIFTILRHPLERILSLYKRLQKESKKMQQLFEGLACGALGGLLDII